MTDTENPKRPDTQSTQDATRRKRNKEESAQEKEHCQELLDEGVEESFPASDTPTVSHID